MLGDTFRRVLNTLVDFFSDSAVILKVAYPMQSDQYPMRFYAKVVPAPRAVPSLLANLADPDSINDSVVHRHNLSSLLQPHLDMEFGRHVITQVPPNKPIVELPKLNVAWAENYSPVREQKSCRWRSRRIPTELACAIIAGLRIVSVIV